MFLRKIYYMHLVNKTQRLSRQKIEELQLKKFKSIIRYAYENVPFYKTKFDSSNIKPGDIKSREDILKIPFTEKREVLENSGSLFSKKHSISSAHIESTSGSGGLKLKIALDYKGKDFCDCVYGRALFAIGYKPWQAMAYFWPAKNHSKEFHEYLGLMRKNWITSHIRPEEQLEILLRLKPKIIYAFPSLLVVIAKRVEADRGRYASLKPVFIVSHAELLTEDTRGYLESVFGCPVYNEYGATEFGFRMAWECKERKGLHIDADSVWIEFLDENKPVKEGQRGEMVVSGLLNHAMPLIRYRIGDIGVPSNRYCACGRGLPLMEYVEGRDDDFLILSCGARVSPRAIIPLIEKHKEVSEFRVIQEDLNRLTVFLVADGSSNSRIEESIKEDILNIVKVNMEISVNIVESIPRNERGKLRAVISNVRKSAAAN